MNKSIGYGAASLSALALLVVTARQASTQVQGSLPAYVKLQATTPGTAQTGNSNLAGTSIAGQFKGGGAGLTGVNADLLGGLDSSAFLQSVPVPLTLDGTDSNWIIAGRNNSTSTLAAGVAGINSASSGLTAGIFGKAESPDGFGVVGYAPAISGNTVGVSGEVNSTSGIGVLGIAGASSGSTSGVYGLNSSNSGSGVYGESSLPNGFTYGGKFRSASPDGRAVFGENTATSGPALGGRFGSFSSEWRAVFATANAASGRSYGVYGDSFSTQGIGVFGLANASGGFTTGLYGQCISDQGDGVVGIGGFRGGYFVTSVSDGYGVVGAAASITGNSYGALGACSNSGYGAYSQGRFGASGTKSFRIDHPSDPENKYLLHYCSEGPEPLNVYSGNMVTDDRGYATIVLPDYFGEINKDPRYTLTVVDGASEDFVQVRVVRKIQKNQFTIRTSSPHVEVSWRVDAVRNDRWVQKYGAPVETEKVGREKGTYQHPELYGKPARMGTFYDPKQPVVEENRVGRP